MRFPHRQNYRKPYILILASARLDMVLSTCHGPLRRPTRRTGVCPAAREAWGQNLAVLCQGGPPQGHYHPQVHGMCP